MTSFDDLSDELKKKILLELQKSVRNTNVISVHQSGLSGGASISANISSGGGTGGSFTITIEGLKVSAEIMHKIFRRWRAQQVKYYEPGLVTGTNRDSRGNLTATGQTLGQIKNERHLRDNLSVDDNVFSFQIPDADRLGDINNRKDTAKKIIGNCL